MSLMRFSRAASSGRPLSIEGNQCFKTLDIESQNLFTSCSAYKDISLYLGLSRLSSFTTKLTDFSPLGADSRIHLIKQ
jgi:hypothetical protein